MLLTCTVLLDYLSFLISVQKIIVGIAFRQYTVTVGKIDCPAIR
jgi:hypothetical protein